MLERLRAIWTKLNEGIEDLDGWDVKTGIRYQIPRGFVGQANVIIAHRPDGVTPLQSLQQAVGDGYLPEDAIRYTMPVIDRARITDTKLKIIK